MTTRRRFLASLAATTGTLAAGSASALGESSRTGIGKLKHAGDWNARPEALRRLLWETAKRTSIHVPRDATEVDIGDEMFWYPLVVLNGQGELPAFTERERAMLLRHLRFGGVLWIDAADAAFARSAQREMEAVLPSAPMKALPEDHVLFKSYFLLKGAVGRGDKPREVLAANVHDRAAVLLTSCDVLGAYERDKLGTWRFECTPGGSKQRERAFRFGVNVVMYATCLDYKADQVHIPFIMKKKRR
jgi:hypothetical protein